jgi:hypothetical protein
VLFARKNKNITRTNENIISHSISENFNLVAGKDDFILAAGTFTKPL